VCVCVGGGVMWCVMCDFDIVSACESVFVLCECVCCACVERA